MAVIVAVPYFNALISPFDTDTANLFDVRHDIFAFAGTFFNVSLFVFPFDSYIIKSAGKVCYPFYVKFTQKLCKETFPFSLKSAGVFTVSLHNLQKRLYISENGHKKAPCSMLLQRTERQGNIFTDFVQALRPLWEYRRLHPESAADGRQTARSLPFSLRPRAPKGYPDPTQFPQ